MARMGTFAGASEVYGEPLSYIHPADNDFAKARFHQYVIDPRFGLTDREMREAQEEIDQVLAALQLAAGQEWRKRG